MVIHNWCQDCLDRHYREQQYKFFICSSHSTNQLTMYKFVSLCLLIISQPTMKFNASFEVSTQKRREPPQQRAFAAFSNIRAARSSILLLIMRIMRRDHIRHHCCPIWLISSPKHARRTRFSPHAANTALRDVSDTTQECLEADKRRCSRNFPASPF